MCYVIYTSSKICYIKTRILVEWDQESNSRPQENIEERAKQFSKAIKKSGVKY